MEVGLVRPSPSYYSSTHTHTHTLLLQVLDFRDDPSLPFHPSPFISPLSSLSPNCARFSHAPVVRVSLDEHVACEGVVDLQRAFQVDLQVLNLPFECFILSDCALEVFLVVLALAYGSA